ncbi:unnamed protein product [Caenorhabditis auriculariae]|uniref:Uncharacterized protein n=1 Tax=Caenorhabditis auriculariae TaxID=2777116 RepID=A0A8S1GWZ5_9PELO|nr:unnamed protein product [Caenorhabditis auriculariae]
MVVPSEFAEQLLLPMPPWWAILLVDFVGLLHIIAAFFVFFFVHVKPVCAVLDKNGEKFLADLQRDEKPKKFKDDVAVDKDKETKSEASMTKKTV